MPPSKKIGDASSFSFFKFDNRGILGLPLKVVVALIIGATAIGLVVGYVMTNAPEYDTLEVSTNTRSIEEGLGQEIAFTVRDGNGNPVKDATVTCTGCGDAIAGKTNKDGRLTLEFDPLLSSEHRSEEYLDVKVRARDFNTYQKQQMIQVTEADYSGFLTKLEDYAESCGDNDPTIIREYPIEISDAIERGEEEIYIIHPEFANEIPDNFYASFLGDGMTDFHYYVEELYEDDFKDGEPAAPSEKDDIDWEDGYVNWGNSLPPKEFQGCNCVNEVRLKHQSPRSLLIIIERRIKKVPIEINLGDYYTQSFGEVEIPDFFGNGGYTFHLDNYKHYANFYKICSAINEMLQIIGDTTDYVYNQVSQYTEIIIQLAKNPEEFNEKTKELLVSISENIPFEMFLDNLGEEHTEDVFNAINSYNTDIEDFYSMYKNTVREFLRETLSVPHEYLDEATDYVIKYVPPFSFVHDMYTSYSEVSKVAGHIIDACGITAEIYWKPSGGVNAGVSFGYKIGALDKSLLYEGEVNFFVDYLCAGIPTPVPMPGATLDGAIQIKDPFSNKISKINLHINPNFISASDREYSIKAGFKIEPQLHIGIGGQIGGNIGLVFSLSDEDIKETVEHILGDVINDFIDDGQLQSLEEGTKKYTMIIDEEDMYQFANPYIPQYTKQILALEKIFDLIDLLIQDFDEAGIIDKVSIGLTAGVGGGVGIGVGASADVSGGIAFGISAEVGYWRELLRQTGEFLSYFDDFLYGAGALTCCEVWDLVDEEEKRIEAEQSLACAVENISDMLPEIGEGLLNNVYVNLGFSVGLEISVAEGHINVAPVEGGLTFSSNLGTVLYSQIPWISNFIDLTGNLYGDIEIEITSSVEGTAGIPVLNIGGFASYETSKKVVTFSIQSVDAS